MSVTLCVALLAVLPQGSAQKFVTAPWTESPSSFVAGWTEFKTSGIRISFPPGWSAIHRTAADIIATDNTVKKVKGAPPRDVTTLKFSIYDTNAEFPGSTFRPNAMLNVDKVRLGLSDVLKGAKKKYESLGSAAKIWYVDLPIGRCGLLETSIKRADGGVSLLQIYAIHRNGTEYLVGFGNDSSRGTSMEQESLSIMKTLRFTP